MLRRLVRRLTRLPAGLDPLTVSHRHAWRWARLHGGVGPLVDAVALRVDPSRGFLDVGANVGFFARSLADRVGVTGSVHLFEPVPHLAELCRKTFRDGRYNAVVHPHGLSDENSAATIFTSKCGNLGWNTMVAGKRDESMSPLSIALRRFDDLQIPLPPFVKIDVEGFEYRVLRGMFSSIEHAEKRPLILCEIGWGRNHPDWRDASETFRRLLEIGYKTIDLSGSALDLFSLEKTTDVLFEPIG